VAGLWSYIDSAFAVGDALAGTADLHITKGSALQSHARGRPPSLLFPGQKEASVDGDVATRQGRVVKSLRNGTYITDHVMNVPFYLTTCAFLPGEWNALA
jgi:hypothetical protein